MTTYDSKIAKIENDLLSLAKDQEQRDLLQNWFLANIKIYEIDGQENPLASEWTLRKALPLAFEADTGPLQEFKFQIAVVK